MPLSAHTNLLLCLLVLSSSPLHSQKFGDLKDLAVIKPEVVSRRVSSYDTTGGNNQACKPTLTEPSNHACGVKNA